MEKNLSVSSFRGSSLTSLLLVLRLHHNFIKQTKHEYKRVALEEMEFSRKKIVPHPTPWNYHYFAPIHSGNPCYFSYLWFYPFMSRLEIFKNFKQLRIETATG